MRPDLAMVRRDTIFLTVSGSHAYGLATPQSDRDRRGICLLREPAHYLGLSDDRFEQQTNWEAADDDTVVYDFRKAMRLFAGGNPNMVEMLFTPQRHHERVAPAFAPVLAARGALVTRRLGRNFAAFGRRQFDDLCRQRAKLADPAVADELLGRLGPRRQAAFDVRLGYDTKRAQQALRTLTMAAEVFAAGELCVERPDAARLRAVREGVWTFAEVEAEVHAADGRAKELDGLSTLPEEVDVDAWERLTIGIIEQSLWPHAAGGAPGAR